MSDASSTGGMSGASGAEAPWSRWLRCRDPRPGAPVRLVCLPHAGGSANGYLRWSSPLAGSVEVHAAQYPGREDRFAEAPLSRMEQLAMPLADALAGCGWRDRGLALFGHSMGAMLGYEVAVELQERGCPPDLVILSGSRPPSLHRPGHLHRSSDRELLADLVRLNPANTEALGSRELMSVLLPTIRADYQVIETYLPRPHPRLRCPLLVMLGEEDPEVSAAEARGWESCTAGPARVVVLPGDHFYLDADRDAALAHIGRALAALG